MWPDSSETQELLAAARSGDTEARNRLLERHREVLRRMVGLRMDRALQGRLDASDIVQDVLVEANRRLTDYLAAAKMPFQAWLRYLARDRLIDAHRRHRGAARRSAASIANNHSWRPHMPINRRSTWRRSCAIASLRQQRQLPITN